MDAHDKTQSFEYLSDDQKYLHISFDTSKFQEFLQSPLEGRRSDHATAKLGRHCRAVQWHASHSASVWGTRTSVHARVRRSKGKGCPYPQNPLLYG